MCIHSKFFVFHPHITSNFQKTGFFNMKEINLFLSFLIQSLAFNFPVCWICVDGEMCMHSKCPCLVLPAGRKCRTVGGAKIFFIQWKLKWGEVDHWFCSISCLSIFRECTHSIIDYNFLINLLPACLYCLTKHNHWAQEMVQK